MDWTLRWFRYSLFFLCGIVWEMSNFINIYHIPGGRVLSPIVPVLFFWKFCGDDFRSPLRWPNVWLAPLEVWASRPIRKSPERFEIYGIIWWYSRTRGGLMSKSRGCRRDVVWIFWSVDGFFIRDFLIFRDYVVNRFLHKIINFIMTKLNTK